MLASMKKQMKEQHAHSDRDQKQGPLDCENVIREQETLRQLNNKLQTHIAAPLPPKSNQPLTQSKKEPEVDGLPTSELLTS